MENDKNQQKVEVTDEKYQGPGGKEMKMKDRIMYALSYLGILFFLPLVVCPDAPHAKFHANQGLVLLLTAIVGSILAAIPIIGWILAPLINLAVFVMAIYAIIQVLDDKVWTLPVLGQIILIK